VLSTLHTLDAPESINRILDFFPAAQHDQARTMIAATLKGIVSQRLVPRADGSGRTAITEVLTMTGRVNDLIRNPQREARLTEVISQGSYYGMHTFDQALCELVLAGTVTIEDALRHATRPTDLELLVRAGGQSHPSMDDLPPPPQAVVGTHPDELANDKGNPTNPEQARRDAVAFRQ
jgi:twitching motility protein PilT